ncbi:MAG: histidine kinase [Acidobacteriota bacterium]
MCRVQKRDLASLKPGGKVHVTHYGAAAGIPNGTCSGGSQPAGWRDREGRLWFATEAGVTFIDPRIEAPRAPPSVRIENVLADQRPLNLKHVRLEPGTRLLSIQYTALSLLDPQSLRFRYRLQGFDRDWVDAGSRRTAEYMNLPPGSYQFRVAAGNGDGTWNESPLRLALTVSPHFYQTFWFASLCAAAAIGLAWALHRMRLRQLRHRFDAVLQERARLARDVHDTLAQGFTAILLHLESVSATLSSSPEVARHHVDRVRQTARHSLAEARRAVWDLRRRSSKEGGLATALSDFVAGTTPPSKTSIQVRSRGTIRPIPDAVEEELERLGQEAITNALHHADASTIRVGIAYEREAIRLTVSDDGRGFDPTLAPLARGHFGLLGMRERTQRVHGRLTLRSRSGRGTVVSIRVPLDSEIQRLRLALKSRQPIGDRTHDQTRANSRSAG